ncbi:hypothetical protein SH528x_005428 [Novipirellula sp. SH528]|uniref:hypothetical protein n=1 Tax=Novipirellula sp. SH528 TaxID=3454466 RepID=UPI003FA0370E
MLRNGFVRAFSSLVLTVLCLSMTGCGYMQYKHRKPHITARPASPANRCESPGIPFYLPKPLLVVSKNFYHVEDAKIGLTGSAPIPTSFDNQANYAKLDLTGNFSRSGSSSMQGGGAAAADNLNGEQFDGVAHNPTLHSDQIPSGPHSSELVNDGLGPHMFFTYEIVFVPDLTQKYTIEINGGPGEIRAAMNLVNGWQFTGLGPYYMKDSSTAQNIMAQGAAMNLGLGGASDVINSVANLKSLAGTGGPVGASDVAALAEAMDRAQKDEVFDVSQFPMDQWGTKTVYHADGSTEIVKVPPTIENYAEISVYEASLEGGRMVWSPIAEKQYDREFLGIMRKQSSANPQASFVPPSNQGPGLFDKSGAADVDAEGDAVLEASSVQPASHVHAAAKIKFQQLIDQSGLNQPNQGGVMGASGFESPVVQVQPVSPAATVVSATPYADPELTKQILERAMTPQEQPKRSFWQRLHPKSVNSNTTVNGTTSH